MAEAPKMEVEFKEVKPGKMSDREMLLLAYGALKVASHNYDGLDKSVKIVEEHLFPPKVILKNVEDQI